ncbi:uncharacterized protein LOC107422844 [Ziziphus jujuba]|nr:uncharacterized protein LOC107422844 [Ziziphus jujuba]
MEETPRKCRVLSKDYQKIPSSNSSCPSKEKSNMFRRFMNVVSLKVKNSRTIKTFKAILHRKECNSNSENFEEEPLLAIDSSENDQRLVDQGLQMVHQTHSVDSQLYGRRTIYVKIPSDQKTMVLGAKGYHSVHDIKSMIQNKEGIEPRQYTLVHGGNLLEDYRTLESLNIRTESTLHLILNPRHVLPIFVKTPRGKTVKFEVEFLYKVRDVKTLVESFVGCPVGDCNMFYEGNQLEDCKTLAFYEIEENSVLELQASWIQIFIKVSNGKTITLDVPRSCTIREVKEKLCCKVRVPICIQSIVFAGKQLEEDRNLASYNIQKHYTLHMVLTPSTLVIRQQVDDSKERL